MIKLDSLLESLMVWSRRHARAVVAGAIGLAVIGAVLVSRVTFDADVLRLLPKNAPAVQSFRGFLETFGSLDSLYVVFEVNENIGDQKPFIDAYIAALRTAPEVASVDSQLFEPGRDWTYLSDRVLYLLGPFGTTEALSRLHPPRLDTEILHARDLLSAPSAEIKTYVQQDPIGLFGLLRTQMERQKGGLAFDPTQEGYVSRDGRSRLIIIRPTGAPFDTAFCQALFIRLAEVERAARAAPDVDAAAVSAVRVQTAGSYRISLEAERVIRREGMINAAGSLVLLLAVVLVTFRTPWILMFGTIPLALAALLSLGLNGWLRGGLSPATSGSAGMLFGLGIDAVVLLYVRYLQERQDGQSAETATRRMAGTASSVVLAQTTTVATFVALLALDFPTLNDLGGLVGLGMLLVCPLTLILLPALLTRADRHTFRHPPSAVWLGTFVVKRKRAILVVGLLATIVLGLAATRLRVDTRLERLQARIEGVDFEQQIAKRFGLPVDVLLAVNEREHLEPLIDADRRLSEQLAVRDPSMSVSGIGMLLPTTGIQSQVADVLRRSGEQPDRVRQAVEAAGVRAGFRPDTFAPFFERLPRVLDANARITYDGLIERGLGPIVSRFVARKAGGYVAVTYLYPQGPVDLDALETIVRRADPQFVLTGLTVVNRELGARFMPEFLKGLAIGTIGVAALIYFGFRRLDLTLLALLPTAFGFTWSAGILALFHVDLDLFSLFATVTFLGMAVDYGIYVLYRHQMEGQPIHDVLAHTGSAVAIACLTALVGFGTLVASSYPPLRTFGITSVVTLTCCLTAALLFLPALLAEYPWSRPAR